MDRIFIITRMILKRTFTKPTSVILHLVIPVIASIGLFLLVSLNTGSQLSLGIVDLDNSSTSVDLINVLESTSGLNVHSINKDDIEDSIKFRENVYVIEIPKNFEESIIVGEEPKVDIYTLGDMTSGWIEILVNQEIRNYVSIAGETENIDNYKEIIKGLSINKNKLSTIYEVDDSISKEGLVQTLGTYLLLLMISTFMMTFKILEEKEKGTFARIGLTSAHPRIYILANMIAGLVVSMLQIAMVLIGLSLLGVNFFAPVIAIYLILVAFSLCVISLSVLIAIVAKSGNAATATIGFVVSPSCMIAGCMWPIRYMPEVLQKLAYLMPQRWVLDAIIMLQKDKSIVDIMPNLLVVSAFTMFFALLSVYKLRVDDNQYA